MSNKQLEKPVFVVGHPRSGTTLLSTVIGRNSEVAMPPETQLLIEHPQLFGRQLSVDDMAEILASKRVADLALESAEVLTQFSETDSSFRAAFATILDRFRAKQGKQRAGEKSPMHLWHAETILSWFPDAKIICIERNGADVVASMMRMPWAHKKFVKHVFAWTEAMALARYLERRFPEKFLRVSYERFTDAPAVETRAICSFCGFAFEPGMLDAGDTSAVPDWEKDWKGGASRKVEVQPSRGIEQLSPFQRAQLGTLANRELARAGYAIVPVRFWDKIFVWISSWPYHPSVHPIFRNIKARVWR